MTVLSQLQQLNSRLLVFLRILIDMSVKCTISLIDRCGPNGYFLYGIIGNILYYGSSMIIRNYPQIDWSVNLMVRGIMTWIFSYILTCTHGVSLAFSGNELKYISMRNGILGAQQLFFFYVITMIPNKIVWVIMNVGPVFVFVLSHFILRTRLTCTDIAYLLLSLLGVNIITAPQLILELFGMSSAAGSDDGSASSIVGDSEMDATQKFIAFMYFCSQVFWGLAIVVAKLSPSSTSLTINHNLGFSLMAFGAIGFISRADVIAMPSIPDLCFDIVYMAIPAFISQMFFIHGTIVAKDPGMYTLTNYILVFISYVMQFIDTAKSPTLFEIIGVAFAIYGVYKVVSKPKTNPIPITSATTLATPIIPRKNNKGDKDDEEEELQDQTQSLERLHPIEQSKR